MPRLAAAALLLLLTPLAPAADDKTDKPDTPEKKTPSLGIGDAAPALKATKWLQGAEVKSFEPGKVYVVEFWATWCGPCIVMMPHVSQLQDEYRDKGVVIVGFSAKDPNNGEEKVTEFVEKRGKKLHYTLAYADDRETHNAFMKAAQRNGIPCSFVIDKAGKIAYIGHPMMLDDVLPKVVAGTWNGKDDAAEVEKGQEEMQELSSLARKDPEAALKAYGDFKKKRPNLAKSIFLATMKLSLLLKLDRQLEAKAEADRLVEEAKAHDDGGLLGRVASTLSGPGTKDNKMLQVMAVRVAEMALKANGEKDLNSLLTLASAHFAAGDKAKAREIGAKAVEAADPKVKKAVENIVKRFDDEPKKD